MSIPAKPTEEYVRRKKRQLIELRPVTRRKLSLGQRALTVLIKVVLLPVVWVYKGLLGWWLDPLSASRFEKKLGCRVRDDLAFLFEKHGARFVPNERKYKYGKVVTLETDKLRFEAAWDRGDYFLRVAPLHAPLDWEEIGPALMAVNANAPITTKADFPPAPSWSDLDGLAKVLEPQFAHLEEALSPAHYGETIHVIEKMEEISRQEFIERLNRGARFYRDHPEASPWNKREHIQTLGLKDYPEN